MIIGVVLGSLHVLLTFLDGGCIIGLNDFKDCRSYGSAVKKVGAVDLVAVLGIFCGKAIGTGAGWNYYVTAGDNAEIAVSKG